ncbi:MAG: phosphate ABC transporter permease subunit PstC [Desulforegulaceae bacterium]|jgi:phosphate transport system permease protein|nr:phosphate ABC transporter permease subunit PstC [Desulforegulaceae bacterium]
MTRESKEKKIRLFFLMMGFFCIFIMAMIIVFLFIEGFPLFKEIKIHDFLFGKYWYPTYDPADFGILALIVGSLLVTIISGSIAVPLGLMTAIYIAEVANEKVSEFVKPLIELLASIPSVVIGFFGMVIVAPFLQEIFNISSGLNIFNASLMLAFMSVPTICSLSEDAIKAVPSSLKEASLGLGATHFETIVRVIIPSALSGISTSVILGMSRAMGETMVVLMVAGGAAMIPGSIFDPVRPMPASIAAEMGEAPVGSEHYHALFAIGFVLFLFTLLFNLMAAWISNRFKQRETGF